MVHCTQHCLKNGPHGIAENGKISPQISANKNIESVFTERNNIYISFTEDQTGPDPASNGRQSAVCRGSGKQVTMETVLAAKDCTAYTSIVLNSLLMFAEMYLLNCCLFYFQRARNDDEGMKFVEGNNLFALIFSSDFFSVFSFSYPHCELGGMADEGFVVDI